MKSVVFQVSMNRAFEISKKCLIEFGCNIISEDLEKGEISAKKEINLLSFGNRIALKITRQYNNYKRISVNSDSVGVQILAWGENQRIEEELIYMLSYKLS